MISITFCLLVFTIVHAAPACDKLAYAAELFGEVTPSQMACLRKEQYKVALVEAYSNGKFNDDAIPTAWNAVYTNMGIEVYMIPDTTLEKSAKQQVDETIMGLISKGLTVTDLWIKATDLSKWNSSIMFNYVFLSELVNAVKAHGRKVGIITSSEAFYKITPGMDHVSDDVRLWYTISEPQQCNGTEGADFGDFQSFAGWMKPDAKQYCVGAKACDVTINGNVVSPASIWTPSS
ncbi:hypothetical protein Y032_0051g2108 [Ancylostoma ceylanicum]|nr:hypothetical protein Y032_0051g2108 [Ancylostoma ceylanicum]